MNGENGVILSFPAVAAACQRNKSPSDAAEFWHDQEAAYLRAHPDRQEDHVSILALLASFLPHFKTRARQSA